MLLDERFHVEARSTRRWRFGLLVVAGWAAVGLSVLTLSADRPAVAAGDPESSGQPAATALSTLRSPAQRAAQLQREGGNEATEKAVAAALQWIVRHQSPDGSWGLGAYRKQCQDPACADVDRVNQADPKAAATAMGLLPLLAAGHSHQVPGPYQTAVQKGLEWLVQNQRPDGDLSAGSKGGPMMYCHGLAALALCDAYALTGDKELAGAAQRAVAFIEAAQDPQGGGWRYVPRQSGDTSVFGWQVAALRAAQLGQLKIQPATLDGARKYLRSVAVGDRGGRFCYTPGGQATPGMTAVGLIGSQFLGAEQDAVGVRDGQALLLQSLPALRTNSYALYYATQALHQAAGKDWQTGNEAIRDFLVGAQDGGPGCAAGSWDPAKDMWGQHGGRLMITSFACLSLEVYYRYPRLAPTRGLASNPPAAEHRPHARASRGTSTGRSPSATSRASY